MASGKDRLGRGLRLGAVLAAAATLALAAVALNAARGTALVGQGPLKSHWLLVMAAVGGLCWLLVVRTRSREDRVYPAPPMDDRIDSLLLPGLVLTALLTAVGLAVLGTSTHGFDPRPQPVPTTNYAPKGTETGPPLVQQPPPPVGGASATSLTTLVIAFALLVALAVLTVLVVFLVRWMHARRAGAGSGIVGAPIVGDGTEDALADAVGAGRQALADDHDPRFAIIACYAAMEASLAESGVSRQRADTPADLLDRAATAGLVQGEAARTLTDLFREARYSTHPMGEHQRDQARAALEAIAAHLAAADGFGPIEELQV